MSYRSIADPDWLEEVENNPVVNITFSMNQLYLISCIQFNGYARDKDILGRPYEYGVTILW